MYIAVAILLIVFIALAWLRYGFWSAFLHMFCVIVAGALAFAAWEPVAMLLLGAGQEWLADMAWSVGLVMPFIIILLLLRVACDKLVPANLKFPSTADIVGGLACGVVSGVISSGILTIGMGYLRFGPEFLGYQPIVYNNAGGSLIRGSNLLLPVDRITAGLYAGLSEGSFRPVSGESLAKWRPDPVSFGGLLRTNFEDGSAKHIVTAEGVKLLRRYQFTSDKLEDLLTDTIDPLDPAARTRRHEFSYLDGTKPAAGQSQIEGYVVNFEAAAKEASGQIIVGAGQVQLVVLADPEDATSATPIQPLAVISQATGDKATLGRWRFDSANVFIASNSAQASATMAFEFVVPKAAKPLALYVKGVRFNVSAMEPAAKYSSQSERDSAVRNRSILSATNTARLNRTGAVQFRMNTPNQSGTSEPLIQLRDSLPFNMSLQKDILKGLLTPDGGNAVSGGGLAKFSREDLKTQGLDAKLVVRKFEQSDDSRIVQVIVDKRNATWGLLSDIAANVDRAKPPQLIDANGAAYQAVGYAYQLGNETWLYFNPAGPLQSQFDQEMPALSRSQPDQQLILVFRVARGVKISSFALGEQVIADFLPPMDIGR